MLQRVLNERAPATEERITETETRLGVRLPDRYRQHLLAHNGGRPEPSVYRAGRGWEAVQIFYAVDGEEHDDIVQVRNALRGRIPKEFLGVAEDSFGNVLCLGVAGPHLGHVYFWDHEREGGRRMSNMTLVAKSWDEFLGMLQDMPA